MAIVQVKINGRDYHIACDDGQEEQLRLLGDDVDERMRALLYRMGNSQPGEAMGLVMTALTMADELAEHKKEMKQVHNEIRRLNGLLERQNPQAQEVRIAEMETTMALTLEEIAIRIEKIADQIEIG